jgi:putative phosphoribosyl transferase
MRIGSTSTRRVFANRRAAGQELASKILELDARRHGAQSPDALPPILDSSMPPVVLALPRGGVPVGYEVASALGAPLDVLLARKIGAPGNPELGMGAIAESGVRVLSEDVMRGLLVSQEELEHSASTAEAELRRRVRLYRGERPPIALEGRTAIVVDDGLATGGTARAAIRAAKRRGAARVLLAVPVGAQSTVEALALEADEVICLLEPDPMWAIGMWYGDFGQVPDNEVLTLLADARAKVPQTGADSAVVPPAGSPEPHADGRAADDPQSSQQVRIPYENGLSALGDLTIPEGCRCLVLFAHGSGSSRASPRNRQVAAALNAQGIGTLLFDLLTVEEERERAKVFDIRLLASRLEQATLWARAQSELALLPIGYFGASTGAAAALLGAADLDGQIGAVVSRGGRPDLAAPRLHDVKVPVLLIVGGADAVVLDLNRQALRQLDDQGELQVIPGATHLFEEPGALDEVARLAGEWLARHLGHGVSSRD